MKTLKVVLPFKLKRPVLALGSQAKNTICFADANLAQVSPIHNDLSLAKDLLAFERDAKILLKKRPGIIACDMHPEYQSTKFSEPLRSKYRVLHIQHHHAHIASCMTENGLRNQKVIGIAFDGTGLGADNRIWGAEFLLCDYRKSLRLAHLKEIPLVGGERAILEPWRLVAAWLNFDKSIDKKQMLKKIYRSGINSPLASSMGRLFDAVGSLILGKDKVSFEAELAIELEKLAAKGKVKGKSHKFNLAKVKDGYIIDPAPLFKQIIADLKSKKARQDIARCFHQGIAEIATKICVILRKDHKINKVALSGGVFQNKILLKSLSDLLYKNDFEVFTNKKLSCNDACISLGQAVIAGLRG